MDFSFNPLADPRFMFHDHALVEAVKLENPEVHAFFRLLALCHTVMAEEKTEGKEPFSRLKQGLGIEKDSRSYFSSPPPQASSCIRPSLQMRELW